MESHRGRGVLKVGLLVAALLLALGPAPVAAADCTGNQVLAVLTETIETVEFTVEVDGVHRVATAKEVGTLSNACGNLAFLEGAGVKVQPVGSDVMVGLDGKPTVGTLAGSVKFYPHTSGGVMKGTITGALDFTTLGSVYVGVTGKFELPGAGIKGTLSGLALMPFPCAAPSGFCYLDVTGQLGGGVVPLTIEEAQPEPLSKFVVTLSN
jgi:hypothetical protein